MKQKNFILKTCKINRDSLWLRNNQSLVFDVVVLLDILYNILFKHGTIYYFNNSFTKKIALIFI